jgi:hypothetical protein
MNSSNQEILKLNRGKSEVVLGSCLGDGDVSPVSTVPHFRREAFGISLAVEILILGLLIAAPLFSNVAQPQFRPLLPAQFTFFHPGPPPRLGDRVSTQAVLHRPQIVDPYQPVLSVLAVPSRSIPEMISDPWERGSSRRTSPARKRCPSYKWPN